MIVYSLSEIVLEKLCSCSQVNLSLFIIISTAKSAQIIMQPKRYVSSRLHFLNIYFSVNSKFRLICSVSPIAAKFSNSALLSITNIEPQQEMLSTWYNEKSWLSSFYAIYLAAESLTFSKSARQIVFIIFSSCFSGF